MSFNTLKMNLKDSQDEEGLFPQAVVSDNLRASCHVKKKYPFPHSPPLNYAHLMAFFAAFLKSSFIEIQFIFYKIHLF